MLIAAGSCALFIDFSGIGMLSVILFGALSAMILSAVCNVIPDKYRIGTVLFYIISVGINILYIIDLFLLIKFFKTFDEDILFVIRNTNQSEASGFFSTFVDVATIIEILAIVLCTNAVAVYVSRFLMKRYKSIAAKAALWLSLFAIIFTSTFTYLSLFSHSPISIPKYNIFMRFAKPLILQDNGYALSRSIYNNCVALDGKVSANPQDSTIYVVVIGESHNKFHSSLYGYKLPTEPNITRRYDEGEIVRFDNCVTKYEITHLATKDIYSLAPTIEEIDKYPIFPAVFRYSGYTVEHYDNNCYEDGGTYFLNDSNVQSANFDFYTDSLYTYDGDFIENLLPPKPHSLVIIHLMGQHFGYKDRIAPGFERTFTLNDYLDRPEEQRELLRDYDNATRYFDSVMERIIEHYGDHKVCLIYFSDHGEALWEDGYVGHGLGIKIKKGSRLHIPFFVWGSEKFRDTDTWQALKDAAQRPLTHSDVSHLLIDISGIKYDGFDPTRSVINSQYNPAMHSKNFNRWESEVQR